MYSWLALLVISLSPTIPLPPPPPHIQLQAASSQHFTADMLGLAVGSSLLNSTKQCLVNLASGAGVLASVQRAAQQVLLCGWNFLLPTVSERASALLDMLPTEDGVSVCLTLCVLV